MLGHDGRGAVGGADQRDIAELMVGPTHQIEAEVADVALPLGGDDHVIGVSGEQVVQVGVLDQAAVGLLPQDAAILHRDHEHAAVGQPAQAGGLTLDHTDLVDLSVVVHLVDGLGVEIHEPELVVVPARSFGVAHPGGNGAERLICHLVSNVECVRIARAEHAVVIGRWEHCGPPGGTTGVPK